METPKQRGQKRHGDLLFVPLERKPDGTIEVGRTVLVRGEATGHAHTLLDEADVFVNADGTLDVVPKSGTARVAHDEHATITVGKSTVYIQQEYDPSEGMRRVQD